MMSLFPKDAIFYQLFEKQTEILSQTSEILNSILNDGQKLEDDWLKLKDLEHEADNIGHEVMAHLRKNFITPLEGEDIDLLRQNLDDPARSAGGRGGLPHVGGAGGGDKPLPEVQFVKSPGHFQRRSAIMSRSSMRRL